MYNDLDARRNVGIEIIIILALQRTTKSFVCTCSRNAMQAKMLC